MTEFGRDFNPNARDSDRVWFVVPPVDNLSPQVTDQLRDFLGYGGGGQLGCSARAWDLLSSLRLDSTLKAVPASVVNLQEELLSDDYFYISSEQVFPVVDRVRSKLKFYIKGNPIIGDVREWALLDSSIPPLDLFRCDGHKWIASGEMKELFEANHITGCTFKMIWDTDNPIPIPD